MKFADRAWEFLKDWSFIFMILLLLTDITISLLDKQVGIAERLERADTRIDAHIRSNEKMLLDIDTDIELLMRLEEQRAR